MTRKTGSCLNCGEERDIAAHGLCFKCYRQEERNTERLSDITVVSRDRHNPGLRKEHKKLFRGLTSVMTGLSDLGASKSDVLAVLKIMEPYMAPIAGYVSVTRGPVNSEQESENPFTVHSISEK